MDESALSARRLRERGAKLRNSLDEAQLRAKDAEKGVLEAKLDARDAEIELLLLQWGETARQLESALGRERELQKLVCPADFESIAIFKYVTFTLNVT